MVVGGIGRKINAFLDGVGCKNLKTIALKPFVAQKGTNTPSKKSGS